MLAADCASTGIDLQFLHLEPLLVLELELDQLEVCPAPRRTHRWPVAGVIGATACDVRAILNVSIDNVVKHAARLMSIRDGDIGHESLNLMMSPSGSMHSYSERTTK